MQPICVIASRVAGLVYINGRTVGEIGTSQTAMVPVTPRGIIYVEHRPFESRHLPLARRLVMSGGWLMPECVEDTTGISVIAWQGGVMEIELEPEALDDPPMIPTGADDPEAAWMEDGTKKWIEDLHDTAGHALMHTYVPETDGGWRETNREVLWAKGAPHWPDMPEGTALAAVEAYLLGLPDEMRGYLMPGMEDALNVLGAEYDGCVSMRFALPDGRNAIGLVRLINQNYAKVTPMLYTTRAMGGAQGTWRLDGIFVQSLAND